MAPPIAGRLAGGTPGASIERSVRHHDNPRLGATDAALVAPDGSFEFPALNLEVTAQEFSKTYVLTLSLTTGDSLRTLYREEYSRLALPERLSLACDLASRDTQPCRPAP